MFLLNTKNKMNIIETEDYNVYNLSVDDSFLDLKRSEVLKQFNSFIETITTDNNVIQLYFGEFTEREELLELVDYLVTILITAILTEEKKEEEVWQPKNSLVEQLNIMLHYQIQLINYKSKLNNFNIIIYHKQEKIYEMIEPK